MGRGKLPYSESEICAMYRDAADRDAQLSIIAQLCDVQPCRIAEILRDHGYDVANVPAVVEKNTFEWTWSVEQFVKEEVGKGTKTADIADMLGVSRAVLYERMRRHGISAASTWTDEDIAKMERMVDMGKSWREIGEALGGSAGACSLKHTNTKGK